MWYVFHFKGEKTLYASNERPEDESDLEFLEEGTRLQDSPDVSECKGGEQYVPRSVVCRSIDDRRIFGVFRKDSIPEEYELTDYTYGGHYNKEKWREHHKHILQTKQKEEAKGNEAPRGGL